MIVIVGLGAELSGAPPVKVAIISGVCYLIGLLILARVLNQAELFKGRPKRMIGSLIVAFVMTSAIWWSLLPEPPPQVPSAKDIAAEVLKGLPAPSALAPTPTEAKQSARPNTPSDSNAAEQPRTHNRNSRAERLRHLREQALRDLHYRNP